MGKSDALFLALRTRSCSCLCKVCTTLSDALWPYKFFFALVYAKFQLKYLIVSFWLYKLCFSLVDAKSQLKSLIISFLAIQALFCSCLQFQLKFVMLSLWQYAFGSLLAYTKFHHEIP